MNLYRKADSCYITSAYKFASQPQFSYRKIQVLMHISLSLRSNINYHTRSFHDRSVYFQLKKTIASKIFNSTRVDQR